MLLLIWRGSSVSSRFPVYLSKQHRDSQTEYFHVLWQQQILWCSSQTTKKELRSVWTWSSLLGHKNVFDRQNRRDEVTLAWYECFIEHGRLLTSIDAICHICERPECSEYLLQEERTEPNLEFGPRLDVIRKFGRWIGNEEDSEISGRVPKWFRMLQIRWHDTSIP